MSLPKTRSSLLLSAALLMLASRAAAAVLVDDQPSTVGSTTESNGLQRNGRFVVRTPSILRVDGERQVPPNLGAAIAQYDRILALPAEAAIRAYVQAVKSGAYPAPEHCF